MDCVGIEWLVKMSDNSSMKYTKKHQNQYDTFKKKVKKEKKRLRIEDPKWTFSLDKKPDVPKLKLNYTIPYQVIRKDNLEIRYKQKQRYLKHRDFNDLELVLRELGKYHSEISEEQNYIIDTIQSDKSSIRYWIDMYLMRGENEMKELSVNSIMTDTSLLNDFYQYIKDETKLTSIYQIDRDQVFKYLTFRYTKGGLTGKKFSAISIHSYYRRVRGWYNWMSLKDETELSFGLLNNMGKELPKVEMNTESFSPSDIKIIYNFMEEEKDNPVWCWLFPILRTLLLTGCRINECLGMRIEDVDVDTREWFFQGKGMKSRRMKFQDEQLWNDIKSKIFDEDGKIMKKTYVFHQHYWRKGHSRLVGFKQGQGGWIINHDLRFHNTGINKKFKKMIRHLHLNDSLTPHSCRRFYITEMLKSTNGNIPLVAQLVGHSSWDMVKRYAKSVILDDTKTNLNLKDVIARTT